MNGDLISRAGLLKKIRAYADSKVTNEGVETANNILKTVQVIEKMPAVDAVPVVHGQWIDSKGAIRCSECLHTPLYDYHGRLKLSKACPTCGANMWKEREE